MASKQKLLSGLAAVGVLLGTLASGNLGLAQMEMEQPLSETEIRFRRIEQPLAVKVGVTAGGIALIGLELWWFLFSKTKAQRVEIEAGEGVQEVTITVDGGYEPSRVIVNAGQPVRLKFLRRDPNRCLEKVLVPDFHIAQALALNHVTSVELTPQEPGEYPFTCGMNMYRGVIEVH